MGSDLDNAGLQVRPLHPPLLLQLGLARRASEGHDVAIQSVLKALESFALPKPSRS